MLEDGQQHWHLVVMFKYGKWEKQEWIQDSLFELSQVMSFKSFLFSLFLSSPVENIAHCEFAYLRDLLIRWASITLQCLFSNVGV